MTTDTFWTALRRATAPYRLLSHPFYQAWSRGELSREDLRDYAVQYYHHVAAFPTYLSRLHAGLGDGPLRRQVAGHIADEEGLGAPDHEAHSTLWLHFAQGMGADRDTVQAAPVMPEVAALIERFRTAMDGSAAAAMTALYVYEAAVPEIAAEKASGLTTHYGAAGRTTAYFDLHRHADIAHSQAWRAAIQTELARNPDDAANALATGQDVARALWTTLDGIERSRVALH